MMKAIILGGTSAHIPLIKNLKQRGYTTYLIDYNRNPVAKSHADVHLLESTMDKEKVYQIAKELNADLVIATSVDQANAIACYVSERLELTIPYSYKTALNVTNKALMKSVMEANNIPTSKYYHIKNVDDLEGIELDYPVIVKPTNSNGSKGVKKIEDQKYLIDNIKNAMSFSSDNEAIIEEYKFGQEIGIDCFVSDGEVKILTTRSRKKILQNNNSVEQIYGTKCPANITIQNYEDLLDIANKIAKSFKLNNTPLMIQAIISENEINIIEFAPRVGGGESSKFIMYYTGFDIINATIDSFLNIPVKVSIQDSLYMYSDILLYAQPCVYGKIKNYDNLIKNGVIEYMSEYKSKGMKINSEMTSVNRVGAFLVKATDEVKLQNKIELAISELEIYDINGKPVLNREIYKQHV